jgi:hypothetical protein
MELEPTWRWFCQLSRRRQSGMAACPLTYTELEAFERKALVEFSAWQADLIMRLDDAVLAVWAEKAKPGGSPTEIVASDTESLRTMVKARAAQKRLEEEARAQARAERMRR